MSPTFRSVLKVFVQVLKLNVPAVGYTEFMPFPGRESVQAKFVR